ncbi:hypothetical protein BHM03_00038341 [Ensete ventricosum]|nr:hypothetical protein BHM03_00038341 [Ensete ventricosum]
MDGFSSHPPRFFEWLKPPSSSPPPSPNQQKAIKEEDEVSKDAVALRIGLPPAWGDVLLEEEEGGEEEGGGAVRCGQRE